MGQISEFVPLPDGPRRELLQHTALAVVLAGISLTALYFVLWPPAPGTSRMADTLVAVVTLSAAVYCATAARDMSATLGTDLPLLVAWASCAYLAATRHTSQGQLLLGFPMMTLAVLAAYFLPRHRMLAHITCMFTAYLLGTLIAGDQLAAFYAVAATVTGVMTAAAIWSLRVSRDRHLAGFERQALRDPLTGALNRRGLQLEAPVRQTLAAQAGQPTTVVVIDLDGFKAYNDTHGHRAGDALLTRLVRDWDLLLRVGDRIARTGGDEFVLVLPGVTDQETTTLLRRMQLEACAPWSAGVSPWRSGQDLDDALDQADQDLYLNKRERGQRLEAHPARRRRRSRQTWPAPEDPPHGDQTLERQNPGMLVTE